MARKGVNKWNRSKDVSCPPELLKNNPKKHPYNPNKEGLKSGKIRRNKIGQVIGR